MIQVAPVVRTARYTDVVTPSNRSDQEIRASENPRTRILGIDYGGARIGLAIADTATTLPQPLDTLERVNRNEDMRRLREIVRDWGVRQIVVGLPLRLDGTRGEMAEEATRFAERVRKQLGLPVEMVDERLIDVRCVEAPCIFENGIWARRGLAAPVRQAIREDEPADDRNPEALEMTEMDIDLTYPAGCRRRPPTWRRHAKVPTIIEPWIVHTDLHVEYRSCLPESSGK